MVPRPLDRSGVEAQGDAWGEQNLTRTQGGVSQKQQGGCPIPPFHCVAVVVRLFVLRPADPNRASGEGRDGSDPPFCAAGAARRRGGVRHGVRHRVSPPSPSGRSLPSVCILAGRLPGPHAGRTTSSDERRDA